MIAHVQNRPTLTLTTVAFVFALSLGYATTALPAASGVAQSDRLVPISAEVSLRVIEAGPPAAQSIVLIPGWCFTADIWGKQIAALSDLYHVVAFDPRSQGRSTILGHSNSPDDRAADIAGLVKALALQKPVLVGWSQGVQDVAAYALAFGTGEVGGIVLVDAPVSAGAAGLDAKAAAMVLGRMPIYVSSPRDYLEGMMPYIFKKPLAPSELTAMVAAGLQTPSSVGLANLTLDLFGRDYRPSFKRMDAPTLLIVAGTSPTKDEQIQQPIPNATSAVVDGAGHAVFYDETTQFNALLGQFLEERVKGAAGGSHR